MEHYLISMGKLPQYLSVLYVMGSDYTSLSKESLFFENAKSLS